MSLEAFAAVVSALSSAKQAFDPESSGGGGGVSAETQTGGSALNYAPVGIESLEITPFEYELLEDIYRQEQEEPQEMYRGGPLYLAEGDDIYRQEVVGKRPEEGIMSIETDVSPDLEIEPKGVTLEDIQADLAQMMRRQKNQDRLDSLRQMTELLKLAGEVRKTFDPEGGSIRGQGVIVPGASRSGRGISNRDLRVAGTAIDPFMYRAMKDGGSPDAVLDRRMFAANPMFHGGDVKGPGGPKDDLIPVMASNGEFMLSKAAVDQVGGGNHSKGIAMLEEFNELGNQRYG